MPGPDLKLLEDAARAAGDVALRYFRADPEVWDKGDGQGPVSEADLAVNRLLEADLRAARPGYGWLSEETPDSADRLSCDRVFVVDPIDGTRAFLEGHENFSHSLAIVEGGRPVAGVVHMPAKGLTFAAERGRGATLNGQPIQASGRDRLDGAQVLAARPMMEPARWPGGVPPVRRVFRSSLAYRLCIVASGRFDAMVTFRDAWEWDIAAGDLICCEAGALVTDRTGGQPVYNSPGAMVPGMIAATPTVARGLLDRAV